MNMWSLNMSLILLKRAYCRPYGSDEPTDNLKENIKVDTYIGKTSTSWNVRGFTASTPISSELRSPERKVINEVDNNTPMSSKSFIARRQKDTNKIDSSTPVSKSYAAKTQNVLRPPDQTDRQKALSSEKKADCSRRRPTQTVQVLTSSKFAEKYNLLLDKRLILTTKQIEDLEEKQIFKRKKRQLELELLQAQLEALKKQNQNL